MLSPANVLSYRAVLHRLACTLLLFCVASSAAAADLPNVVLVMADDQGWGDMAYTGHPVLHTPNFDEAAASGLRFDRFYAAAPVCSPTRASVMTGRTPNRMGVFKWGYPIRPQEITVAEALKTAGYRTAHFGKWHLGSVRNQSPAHPGRNGFDRWVSAPNFFDNDPILSDEGTAVQFEGESSIVTAELAIDWIKQQADGDDPFLAVVWFGSPHNPHRAIDEDRELYEDQPENVRDFYGEITGMDRAFGRLRDSLSEAGVRENTLLWYCSDNGALPKLGNTGGHRGDKGDVYEGGLLVPAIVEWPARIKQHRVTDVRCSTFDIYPTLLEITGVEVEDQPVLDGVSLVRVIDGDDSPREEALGFWDYNIRGIGTPSAEWMGELLAAQQAGRDLPPHEKIPHAAELPNPPYPKDAFPGHSAWLDDDWKLHRVENKQGLTWELYNLADDPDESDNVLKDHPARVETMQTSLHEWLASVVDSLNGQDY